MPKLIRLASVFVVAGVAATAVFAWTDRQEEAQALLPVELEVTGIQSGPWDSTRLSPTNVVHGTRVILTPVRVTNRSPTNRANLRFRLQLTRTDARGMKSPYFVDEDVGRPSVLPSDVPNPLLGPLDIAPQTTLQGSISFYVMPVIEQLVGPLSFDPHARSTVLIVTDLVSGKSREFKVPTSMGGTVNILR
jgi:hypothetical protein